MEKSQSENCLTASFSILGTLIKRGALGFVLLTIYSSNGWSQTTNPVESGQEMTIQSGQQDIPDAIELNKNVYVGQIFGGRYANPSWQVDFDNDDYVSVLKTRLQELSYHNEQGRFQLNLNLLAASDSGMGINTSVDTTIQYILKDRELGTVIKVELVESSYRATITQALRPSKRAQIAYRGAVVSSLTQFLKTLESTQ